MQYEGKARLQATPILTSSTYQYYTNNSFPTSDAEPLAYSYYDDYHITHTNTPDYAYAPQGLSGEASADTLVNGMLTAVRKRTVGSGISATWLLNVVFYDSFGRTIQSQSNNQLHASGTPDKSTIVMDFTGKPMLTKTVKISSGTDSIRVQTAYTYDHADRVTAIDQSYNGGTNKRIAAYVYNELGQLIKKNLGRLNSGTSYPYDVTLRSTVIATTNTIAQNSITLDSGFHATAGSSLSYTAKIKTDYLQALDFRYNIRGQLISMNNATLAADTANNADVNDVFGMELLYDKADGGLGNTAYYNGRLSAVKWMTKSGTAYGTQSAQKAYNYSYDELNRLTDAGYYEKGTGGSWVNNKAYDEGGLTYDANGNILSLKRNGVLSGLVKRIDSLTYSYDGNQLTNVTDGTGTQYTANGFKNISGSGSSTPYSYDDNGNLTGDLKKGITNHYNILNRVDSIRVTAGTNQWITYTYDATGTLLRKRQFNGSSTVPVKVTDYIDGFVYEGGSLVYFATNEGRVRDSANVLTNEYVITDTQGNSRVSFEDNGSGIAKVRQENSYYPFGLVMGNSTTPANNANKHLYNGGSEWQNDYADLPDYYQTFYRNYDASIGRFVGVDPVAASAESLTPYQYAYNNPGMLNDPMGDLANVSGEYADFWNRIITGAGDENAHYHNNNGIFEGDNDDEVNIKDYPRDKNTGYDYYTSADGSINRQTANTSGVNRFYKQDSKTGIVTQINEWEYLTFANAEYDRYQRYLETQKQLNGYSDQSLYRFWNSNFVRYYISDMIGVNVSVPYSFPIGGGVNFQVTFMVRGKDAGSIHLTGGAGYRGGVDMGVSVSLVRGWFNGDPELATFSGLLGPGVDLSGGYNGISGGLWRSNNSDGSMAWFGMSAGWSWGPPLTKGSGSVGYGPTYPILNYNFLKNK